MNLLQEDPLKNIFIAGGAGCIGCACTEYMFDPGCQVTIFDSLVTGHRTIIQSVWDWMAKFPNGYQEC